jgi:hypothetical protein
VIDPLERWRELGLPDKPDCAGLLTFARMPCPPSYGRALRCGRRRRRCTQARPRFGPSGTRYGPRAIRAASCPPGPHLKANLDAFAELRVVDVRVRTSSCYEGDYEHSLQARPDPTRKSAGWAALSLGRPERSTQPSRRCPVAALPSLQRHEARPRLGRGAIRRGLALRLVRHSIVGGPVDRRDRPVRLAKDAKDSGTPPSTGALRSWGLKEPRLDQPALPAR